MGVAWLQHVGVSAFGAAIPILRPLLQHPGSAGRITLGLVWGAGALRAGAQRASARAFRRPEPGRVQRSCSPAALRATEPGGHRLAARSRQAFIRTRYVAPRSGGAAGGICGCRDLPRAAYPQRADWEAIDAAFLGHTDPMFGAEASVKYDAPFRRIVNLAPPPLGVGPHAVLNDSRGERLGLRGLPITVHVLEAPAYTWTLTVF